MATWSAQTHTYAVTEADFPVFDGKKIHPVCSTYALAREFEWAGRRVYLAARPELPGTEAFGTEVVVEHKSPAFQGEEITITATPTTYDRGFLYVDCIARVGERLVATGRTGQKVTSAEKVAALFKTRTV